MSGPLLQGLYLTGAMLSVCAATSRLPAQTAPPISAGPVPAAPIAAPAAAAPAAQTQSAATATEVDSAATAKSPADLYKEAMHPLDVVRGSLDNWSDAELGALAVGMHLANQDCMQAKPGLYKGDDLYNFARLCAFGQDWEGANDAALAYIASREAEHRTQAYAITVSALVHMRAVDLAVQTAREMLYLPYDAEVAYALRDLKNSLEQASNPAALPLAEREHAAIVAALQQGVALKAVHGDAVMPVGTLYESAMQLAFLDRYTGDDQGAATAAADVENALPSTATLTAEDRQHVDAVASRYQLLGAHLPAIKILRTLQSPTAKVQSYTKVGSNFRPDFGAATVLVLFPDWCVSCRNMMKALTQFAVLNRTTPIRAYGLVFADDAVVLGDAAHEQNLKPMAGTQTLVVPAATAQILGATDYPLGVVLDQAGIVRFIGELPPEAFNGEGYVAKVIVNMVKTAHEKSAASAKGN